MVWGRRGQSSKQRSAHIGSHKSESKAFSQVPQQKGDVEIVAAGQRQDPGTQVDVAILLDQFSVTRNYIPRNLCSKGCNSHLHLQIRLCSRRHPMQGVHYEMLSNMDHTNYFYKAHPAKVSSGQTFNSVQMYKKKNDSWRHCIFWTQDLEDPSCLWMEIFLLLTRLHGAKRRHANFQGKEATNGLIPLGCLQAITMTITV